MLELIIKSNIFNRRAKKITNISPLKEYLEWEGSIP